MRRLSGYVCRASAIVALMWTAAPFAAGDRSALSSDNSKGAGNLTGAWVLNKDLSDDPSKVMAAMPSQRRHGAGGRAPGMGGIGGMTGGGRMGGGSRPGMDPEQIQRMRELMRRVTEPPGGLTITQTNDTVPRPITLRRFYDAADSAAH